jgi:hypothetical protein
VPERIIIEGSLVRTEHYEPGVEARLVDLLPHIEARPPITVGLLPKSAVMFHWDESNAKNKRVQFLCEMTPGVKTSNYNNRALAISLPWTYFLFDFTTSGNPLDGHTLWTHTNSRVYWAREQVTSLQSEIGTALVPNCDTAGAICYGTTAVDANLPLGVRVDRLVDEFYRSQFTHDSGTGSPWSSETGEVSWDRWVKETALDRQAWTKFPEWETGGRARGRGGYTIEKRTVGTVLGSQHDRFQPIQLTGTIPDLIEPMTFGRAEEWLNGLTPESRERLEVAMNNLKGDPPAAEPEPAAGTTRVTARTRVTPIAGA